MGRLAAALDLLARVPSSFLSDANSNDGQDWEELDAGDNRPDAGSYDYWQKRAATYDQDIFRSSDEDHEGIIHGEIDAAARRAEKARELSKGDDGSHAVSKLVAVDAGCGPGLWLDALTKRFGRVVGVDQSPNLLEKAKVDHEQLLHSKHSKVELETAADLGQPCKSEYAADGQELCGPSVPGTTHSADLVASFNVLLSPNKQARENILRREVEMLRPEPGSTLLLLVPSAESYRAVRKLYRELGGVESGLGKYADYLYDHPDEEADNVFRVFAMTKHYSKKEACSMVEAAGLECDKVLSFPMRWRFVFPFASDEAFDKLEAKPPAHEWVVVAHPKVGAAGGSLLSRARSDFL